MLMVLYRMIFFLLLCLCGLLFGASIGLVLGVLLFGSTTSFFWLFSYEETMLMLVGAVIGGGVGLSIALVVEAEWRRL
jgi:hypothetical protein